MSGPVTRAAPDRVKPYQYHMLSTPLWVSALLGRNPSPSRIEYDALVDALWEGDPLMDNVVEWMKNGPKKNARALFEQALNQGIEQLDNPPAALKQLFDQVDPEPDWLDRSQIAIATHFIHRAGLAVPLVLRDFALMGGYLLSGFNQTLVLTGELTKGTGLRMAKTSKWWLDCTEHKGLQRFGIGFKSTLRVRLVHAFVRRHLLGHDEWDCQRWGVPINQTDMLATYLAFAVVTLVGLRALGIPITREESKATVHLWKYVGWLMGVDESWLVETEREGLTLLLQTFATQSEPDWSSAELGRALANEPLKRQFPWHDKHPRLHQFFLKVLYHQHLSTSSLFLNRTQRQQLGLPKRIYPWYPALSSGPRFIKYGINRLTPKGREKLEISGRQAQNWIMRAPVEPGVSA